MHKPLPGFYLLLALLGVICTDGISQTGLNIKTGLSIFQLKDAHGLSPRLIHFGHRYGFDARVEETRLVFLAGLHYERLALFGDEEHSAFRDRMNLHEIVLPISLGFKLLDASIVSLRVYGGGNLNFVVTLDENPAGLNTDRVTNLIPGGQLGVQGQIGPLTLDIQHVFHGRHFILTREDSRFRGLVISLGAVL